MTYGNIRALPRKVTRPFAILAQTALTVKEIIPKLSLTFTRRYKQNVVKCNTEFILSHEVKTVGCGTKNGSIALKKIVRSIKQTSLLLLYHLYNL